MNLNYLIEDFDNLKKELNIIKKETKDIIKNYSRKIVSLEKDFEKCEYEKIKLKNKLENEIKKFKKKKMIICTECYQEIKISRKKSLKYHIQIARHLKRYEFDLVFDLHNSLRSKFLSRNLFGSYCMHSLPLFVDKMGNFKGFF